MQSPRVFISYSHDSPDHADRVLAFGDRLREHGVNAVIDQYEPHPAMGWPVWMREQMEEADYTLLVITERYRLRFDGKETRGQGLGVAWESNLLHNFLYLDVFDNRKFVPVVFDVNAKQFIPLELKGSTFYTILSLELDGGGYEDLLRRLLDEPKTRKPVLGVPPPLSARERKNWFPGAQVNRVDHGNNVAEVTGNGLVAASSEPDDLGLPQKFRTALREKLLKGQVSREKVERAFLQCRGETVTCRGQTDAEVFDWVANELGDRPIPEDPCCHPAIRFAGLLISLGLGSRPLKDWLEDIARYYRIPDIQRVVQCPGCDALEDRVVIVVEPCESGFHITGWRIIASRGESNIERNAMVARLAAVESLAERVFGSGEIMDCISDILVRSNVCPDTRIELCLPLSLMCSPVEDIRITRKIGKTSFRLAAINPVLIRSWERNYSPDCTSDDGLIDSWRQAWKCFKNLSVARRLPRDFFDNRELAFEELMLLNGKAPVLQFSPSEGTDAANTVVEDLIAAGVPIALWPRGETTLGSQFDIPSDWAASVLQFRKANSNAQVMLLWDDPDRVPKQLPYKAPGLSG